MKTITFYSYKGGVGRSLTLANMANRLAEFGKKVCLIDFDLEAPGLHLKFQNEIKTPITTGLVNYIHSYAKDGILPDTITPYSIRLNLHNNGNIHLIPAGNVEDSEYWRKLSSIDWYNLVYENPNSISFFLDLKQKIKKELQPDFLLIDSRTGISEMSGITISLMADEVIIVSANNTENLEGSKRIIKYLANEEKSILGRKPNILFVLSRIPLPESPREKGREQIVTAQIKNELSLLSPENFFILHSDRELEMNEKMKIGNEIDNIPEVTNKSVQITKEYLKLFEQITKGELTEDEKIRFDNLKKSEKLYKSVINLPASEKKIDILKQALQLNPNNINIMVALGETYINVGDIDMGISTYEEAVKNNQGQTFEVYKDLAYAYSNNNNLDKSAEIFELINVLFPDQKYWSLYGLGYIAIQREQFEVALNYFTKAIEENPSNPSYAYNAIAVIYMNTGKYEDALLSIFKALSIDSEFAHAYATLAEIYAQLGRIDEFYINLEIALSKNVDEIKEAIYEKKFYKSFINENRFVKILEKYDIPLPSYD